MFIVIQPGTSSPPIILSTRFQCPPRAAAEIIKFVRPQRRYSMSAL